MLAVLPVFLSVLLTVAFYTLAERKLMAAIQRRKGPNVVGLVGILQPIADGLKLFFKAIVIPVTSNDLLFLAGPVIAFGFNVAGFAAIAVSLDGFITDSSEVILVNLALSAISVYGVIIAGWVSNNKYAFLGAMRSAAQFISYEIVLTFVAVTVMFCANATNYIDVILAQSERGYWAGLLPLFLIFLITMLAETNRVPFDLPEAEAELVAGYNVEYSGIAFALFFLAEYSAMIFISLQCVVFFFGNAATTSFIAFCSRLLVLLIFFIWVRATIPRYRYDQLMAIGWKMLVPLTLGFLVLVVNVL